MAKVVGTHQREHHCAVGSHEIARQTEVKNRKRVLPAAIRPQISLAYLLARTTDTIADTQLVPPAERLQKLRLLRERILGNASAPPDLVELARHQNSPAEWSLLQRVEESLAWLEQMPAEDRQRMHAGSRSA